MDEGRSLINRELQGGHKRARRIVWVYMFAIDHGAILIEARKRKCPVEIGRAHVADVEGLKMDAALDGVFLTRPGQVILPFKIVFARVARTARRTAAVEGIEHVNRHAGG